MRRVTARAPGKINVSLEVGALQEDGYHELATAFQAVSLFEEVEAEEADDVTVSFDGPVDCSGLSCGEDDLAVRAARLLAEHTGRTAGVRLRVTKHVPIAGGMAGGSADAAAALVACDALWGTAVPRDELLELGARLGADVPFALMGGTAVGTGRGDELSPALSTGAFHWVVVLSDEGMSTPATFRALDDDRAALDVGGADDVPRVGEDVLQALRRGDPHLLAASLTNDLQAPALRLRPDLERVLELGDRAGALAGILSGSGPTIAFLAADKPSAIDLHVALTASQLDALRVRGPVPGARVVADERVAVGDSSRPARRD